MRLLCLLVCFLAAPVPAQEPKVQEPTRSNWYGIPQIGGWALTPDTMTLIVADPDQGSLVLIDTTGAKRQRRVEVEFKPTALAVQGHTLYAAAEGSGLVHAIDLRDFKTVKEYRVAGGAVLKLACHPVQGPVYAALTDYRIVDLNATGGPTALPNVRGQTVLVDANDPKVLYTSLILNEAMWKELHETGLDRVKEVLKQKHNFAVVLKYRADRSQAGHWRLEGILSNASNQTPGDIRLAPDGKTITLISHGGWTDPQIGRQLHEMALFDAGDMKTLLGGLPVGAPRDLAFHPDLDLVAGAGGNCEVRLFKRKSLVERAKLYLPNVGPHNYSPPRYHTEAITFAAHGTRLVFLHLHMIHVVELDLTDAERATLQAKYGTSLPARPAVPISAVTSSVDLLAGVDVLRDTLWGEWTKVDGKLTSPAEGRLHLPWPTSPQEYVVHLGVERLDDSGGVALSLPVGAGRMLVASDFGHDATAGGLGFLDKRNGLDISDAQWRKRQFTRDTRSAFTITIRKTGVTIERDNQRLLAWKGDPSKFRPAPAPDNQFHNLRERWYFPDRAGAFLYATGRFRIDRLELAPLPAELVAQSTPEPVTQTTPTKKSTPKKTEVDSARVRAETTRIAARVVVPSTPSEANPSKPEPPKANWDHVRPGHFKVVDDYLQNSAIASGPTPSPTQAVSTKESYSGPIEINATLRLAKESRGDIRFFAFRSGLLIFNPHMVNAANPDRSTAFRLPDARTAYAGTEVRPGRCPSDFKDWTKVTWRLSDKSMTVLVNDKQFYHVDKSFNLTTGGPARLGGYGGPIDIKSFEVKPLLPPVAQNDRETKPQEDGAANQNAPGFFFSVPGARDCAYDQTRQRLYVTTPTKLVILDANAKRILASVELGGMLQACDVTPDFKFLYIGPAAGQFLYRVKLDWTRPDDLEITRIQFKANSEETGVVALCTGPDGSVLFSMTFLEGKGSGGVRLRRLYPDDTIEDVGGIQMDSMVAGSGDRRYAAIAEGNISNGPVKLYDFQERKLRQVADMMCFHYEFACARDARYFARPHRGGCDLYDAAGGRLGNLAGKPVISAVFHPKTDALFVMRDGEMAIQEYELHGSQPLATYPLDKMLMIRGDVTVTDVGHLHVVGRDTVLANFRTNVAVHYRAFRSGRLKVADDGSHLFAVIPGGVYQIPLNARRATGERR